IETNAGNEASYVDTDYSECGGFIVDNKKEVFRSDIVLKIAPLSLEEIELLKGNQVIISALHITKQSEAFIRKIMQKKVTAIAFENLKDKFDCYPVVRSMSEIAGITSILIASEYLSNVHNGHDVIIETNAGNEASYVDTDYSECGGFIVDNKKEVFRSDIVLKIAPLSLEEIELLKGNQVIISALHITKQSEAFIRKIMQKKVTAIAFENLKDKFDCYPVVRSMSEIAGITSILIASEYLSNVHKGKGVMLGGITGITPAEVNILG
ncbi:unnamed protein product, partial [marine sediment metagenome]